ncbi:MAG: hypothetical protein J6Y02_20905 [Pseudobutyrivibrio sp.]|nr:hypothetical protein [Pseudobutyrivibrio sp.]
MDTYFKKIIFLLVNKKYNEAYELGKEMLDFFWDNRKYYRNSNIAGMDYVRARRYYDYSSRKMLEQSRRETEMLKDFCDFLIQLNKELVDS